MIKGPYIVRVDSNTLNNVVDFNYKSKRLVVDCFIADKQLAQDLANNVKFEKVTIFGTSSKDLDIITYHVRKDYDTEIYIKDYSVTMLRVVFKVSWVKIQ